MAVRHVLRLAFWHLRGRQTPAIGESEARITLYPSTGRNVMASPQKRPRSAENARGQTGRTSSDDVDCH